jgi:hypothetical protein
VAKETTTPKKETDSHKASFEVRNARATARLRRWACRTGSPVMRFSAWAWVGGLPTYATRHRASGRVFTLLGLLQK